MRIAVIIATYNEKENIESLIRDILASPQSFDVLVVDDNSPDGTGAIADRLAEESSRVFVIHRPGKMGLGKALRVGMIWAVEKGYDLACTMDADHSHAPEYLPDMVEAAQNADVVLGSRYIPGGGVRGWHFHRKILSRAANLYARALMGLSAHDCTTGYRVYSRRFLETKPFDNVASGGFSFLVEMLYEAKIRGFTIKEYPIIFIDRVKGISKINPNEMIKGGWNLFRRRMKR